MTAFDRLRQDAADLFGAGATVTEAYDLITVDVPPAAWIDALLTARDTLACDYFDWLSAVDEPGTGFLVSAHLADVGRGGVRHLVVRTTVPHDKPELPTAVEVFAGAAWHERETHEMFGVVFAGHPYLAPLLLPENFEGHPLRKDFVLAARVAKAWPGAKEPGESSADHAGPKRRQMLPPGVPDPNEWGPLKGQLPPAPSRPARTPRAGAGAGAGAAGTGAGAGAAGAGAAGAGRPARAAGDRPARRSRSVTEGSTSQQPKTEAVEPKTEAADAKPEAGSKAEDVEPKTDAADAADAKTERPRRRTDNVPWATSTEAPATQDDAPATQDDATQDNADGAAEQRSAEQPRGDDEGEER